jgi:hypothetical protein
VKPSTWFLNAVQFSWKAGYLISMDHSGKEIFPFQKENHAKGG